MENAINNVLKLYSYQKIIDLYDANKEKLFDDIHIELRQWFAANMSAALGAVLDILTDGVNTIHFDFIKPQTKNILQRNEFLSYYGRERLRDFNHTAIKYQKLKINDGKYFKTYVIEELMERSELPPLSKALKDKIVEAIYEIFVNAQIHSETDFIYTCGQFYPAKNKIEFTIVDTGIGFRERVSRRFDVAITAEKAIRWAVRDRNTTKPVSGGIGLAILREFIAHNSGKMQIVSNEGYYEYSNKKEKTTTFKGQFPGTIVNLQFRTDDNSSYSLKSEVGDINDIF